MAVWQRCPGRNEATQLPPESPSFYGDFGRKLEAFLPEVKSVCLMGVAGCLPATRLRHTLFNSVLPKPERLRFGLFAAVAVMLGADGRLKNMGPSVKKQSWVRWIFSAFQTRIRWVKISLEIVPRFSAKVCGLFWLIRDGPSALGSDREKPLSTVFDNLSVRPCEYWCSACVMAWSEATHSTAAMAFPLQFLL